MENKNSNDTSNEKNDVKVEFEMNDTMVAQINKVVADALGGAVVVGRSSETVPDDLHGTHHVNHSDEKGEMISLMAGDLIWFRTDDSGCKGFVLGDDSLKTVGVEPDDQIGSISPRFFEGVFRICTGLNYRSKTEVGKMNKAIRQAEIKSEAIKEFNPDLARKREALEAAQNLEQLEKLSRGEGSELIKYGDIISLQHVRSGLFMATHKTPAPLNPNCRKVSLKKGSLASHFRILPRFKVRSKGSVVYADDQIQLQSVKFEYLKLGASANTHQSDSSSNGIGGGFSGELPSSGSFEASSFSPTADLGRFLGSVSHLRKPTAIRREASCEVNGSMDPFRCFSVKLFYRMKRRGILLSGHYFRMFHPEANAYVQASSDPDKGEVLDATGDLGDPLSRDRLKGLPAHIPYLKQFVSSADASNPIHLSAKAVWCFEGLDRTRCTEVKWESPLRIRHVPTGKFLSVISNSPAILSEPTEGVYYDSALVFDVDLDAEEGELGSASSMVFNLVATDVTSDTLKTVVSTVRLEHRTHTGRVLHFVAAKEAKPEINYEFRRRSLSPTSHHHTAEAGLRICFSTEPSALDVLKIQPLSSHDTAQLTSILSRIRLFKKYAYLWHAVGLGEPAPSSIAEVVAGQCLDVIDDIGKGSPPPRRHGGSVSEAMKEALATSPYTFAALYGGDADTRLQKVAFEVKLFDAVFEAALAPYNHAALMGKSSPFDSSDNNEAIMAVQKFLYVTIQRIVRSNLLGQDYFARRTSRVWRHITPTIGADGISEEEEDLEEISRHSELWRNIIIDQGEDSLGATVTLGQLLRSSESIVNKLVNNELMDRFKNLVAKCGPELKFINLFTSICYVEGKPSRANQEMCVRKLWMNIPDRYAFGVTFHENIVPETKLNYDKRPIITFAERNRAPAKAPAAFLGKTKENIYKPIHVAWSGHFKWTPNCGALWWNATALKLPVSGERKEEGVKAVIQYVPIEHMMWVLDPNKLCKAVTGVHWKPFNRPQKKNMKRAMRKSMDPLSVSMNLRLKLAQERFDHQFVLASYIVAQLELFTNMCKGRSYNCIRWLESAYSFDMLMNLATNPLLPSKLTGAAIGFVEALYVNRFPQMPYGGAPCLPEKLWVFDDEAHEGHRKSATPVLKTSLGLESLEAFPAFFLPSLSSAHGDPNPILSHPDHFKFFLLRSHCNQALRSFGTAGRIIHAEGDFNQFGMAVIQGQNALLEFGFQSTHIKLKDMCGPNALLLDGRSDLCSMGRVFDPPEARYKQGGTEYETVTKLKVALIHTFNDVADLRANFRLGQLLHIFKEKAIAWHKAELGERNKDFTWGKANSIKVGDPNSCAEAQYILQSTPTAVDTLYADFERMFPGGGGEAAQLDLTELCDKPDMDTALVDAIMYDDDKLMCAALKLLESTYTQRRTLKKALQEVFLLETTDLPVYGDIHVLRADLTEVMYLIRTSSVWGVKSWLSGPFGDEQLGSILSIIDRMHAFIYYQEGDPDGDWSKNEAHYQGYFKETGLDGVTFESKGLYSLDVAGKWAPRLVPKSSAGPANKEHQDILRACNFQAVLIESILMDPEIAWKGSICTEREKEESQRRLTLVSRAFLSVTAAFCSHNPVNQELLFPEMGPLEKLATPKNMLDAESEGNVGLDSRGSKRFETTLTQNLSDEENSPPWPHSVHDLAQALILTVLRGNGRLCERVSPSLLRLFAAIANESDDPSTAPVLDLLFILSKPEVAPETEFQMIAASQILGRPHHRKVAFAMATCVDPTSNPFAKLGDPARLVRLAMALIEGGNERVASQLKAVAAMTIDATCASIVAVVDKIPKIGTGKDRMADPPAILKALTTEGSLGSALLELLIELVFLLPLNNDQMLSRSLWQFLDEAMVPTMEAYGRIESMDLSESDTCGELIGMIELLLITLVRLGIFTNAMETPQKECIISEIAEDVETILSNRQRPPELLETAYMAALDRNGVNTLNVSQFVELVEDLTEKERTDEQAGDDASNKTVESQEIVESRRQELIDAFNDADIDGNGEVDLYEFVRLYNNVSHTSRKGNVQLSKGDVLQKQGHKLSLRTVECCNRIVNIRKGYGNELGAKTYSRGDRYGSRLRKLNSMITGLPSSASFNEPGNSRPGSPLMSAKSRRDIRQGDSNLHEKFNAFKRAVERNPRINEALQRRKFTMVGILEKGTPGPPAEYGRSLICNTADNISTINASNIAMLNVTKQVRRSVRVSPMEMDNEVEQHAPSSKSPNKISSSNWFYTPGKKKKKKKQPAMSKKLTMLSPTPKRPPRKSVKIEYTGDEKYAAMIQSAYRTMKFRADIAQRTIVSRLDGGKNSNRLSGAVELTWADITSRFVRYVSDHYWEVGLEGEVCMLILDTWIAHLVKARTYFMDVNNCKLPHDQIGSAKTLKYLKPHDLTEEELREYHKKQSKLNDLGVTALLARIIASLSDDILPGHLPDKALHLLVELLDGGNAKVQSSLYQHLIDVDAEGKLLIHMEARMLRGFEIMSEAKNEGTIGSDDESLIDDIVPECEYLIHSTRFLQLLCEGHHRGFQNYMRTQPMHTSSHVNLVRSVGNLLILLCDSSYVIGKFTSIEIALVQQFLCFLVESIQGPCPGNQELIAKSDVIAALNSILDAQNWKDGEHSQADPSYLDMRGLSCVLLAATLEGREDRFTHRQLSRRVETGSLEEYKIALENSVWDILNQTKFEGRLPTQKEGRIIKTKQSALVAVMTVLIELNIGVFKLKKKNKRNQEKLVGLVEIAWRGKVERTVFPLPFEIKYLSNATKHNFLETVDLSTADKRMNALIKECDLFISEMDLIYAKAEQSTVYRRLHKHLPAFKFANYGLVMALNLNILLSPATSRNPSTSIIEAMSGDADDHLELTSVIVTSALGLLVTIGYGVIIATLAVTELPLLIQELDENAKDIAEEGIEVEDSSDELINHWLNPMFGLSATIIFIALHMLNIQPNLENGLALYLSLIFFINIPLILKAFRSTIGDCPSTPNRRRFAIVYDLLIKRSFLRNHLLLALCCFLGYFVDVEFFTLELLDVVAISPVIADIIRSVTAPGFALGLVFYLFIITVIIYAAFGMNHLSSSLTVPVIGEDDEIITEYKECGSMLQCFYKIFHEGLSEAGNLKAFLAINYASQDEYPMRVLYDSVFFVWVGIVLVNIIVGLMVDTFSSIREEKQSRVDILDSVCFVCGTLRQTYEDMALGGEAPTFDQHLFDEHDPWIYVHYMSYLKKKDPTEDSGIESYVRAQVEENALDWIPSRTSFFLESQGKSGFANKRSTTTTHFEDDDILPPPAR
jgi:hypothetical protein